MSGGECNAHSGAHVAGAHAEPRPIDSIVTTLEAEPHSQTEHSSSSERICNPLDQLGADSLVVGSDDDSARNLGDPVVPRGVIAFAKAFAAHEFQNLIGWFVVDRLLEAQKSQ